MEAFERHPRIGTIENQNPCKENTQTRILDYDDDSIELDIMMMLMLVLIYSNNFIEINNTLSNIFKRAATKRNLIPYRS